MYFVPFFQAAQNRNRIFDVRLTHKDNLKTPLQGSVFLDVLAVFVQGGGADRTQLAARQRWLKHIGGIDCALGGARSNQRVQFVDKEDDPALRVFDLLKHGLQPIFELAAILCARQHGAKIQSNHPLIL